MYRRYALRAEVFRCFHNTGTKDVLPEPVNCDTRGERMFRRQQPLRETETVSAGYPLVAQAGTAGVCG